MRFKEKDVNLVISQTIKDNELPSYFSEADGPEGNESFIKVSGDRAQWVEDGCYLTPLLHVTNGVIVSNNEYWDLAKSDMLSHDFEDESDFDDLQDYCYWNWGVFVSFVNLLDLTDLSLKKINLPDRWIKIIGYLRISKKTTSFMSFDDVGKVIGNKVYIDAHCDGSSAWVNLTRAQQFEISALFADNFCCETNERFIEKTIIKNLETNGLNIDTDLQHEARYISERGFWYEYDPRDAFQNHKPR